MFKNLKVYYNDFYIHTSAFTVYKELLKTATCSDLFQKTGRGFMRVGFDSKKGMRNRTYDNQSEPCVCECWPQNINSGNENKVRGHHIVEQAATDCFTDILEGVAPMPSTP